MDDILEGALFLVTTGPDCPYPIKYEGVFTNMDIAFHVAEQCGGEVKFVNLDPYVEHLSEKKWVYSVCSKISTPEIIYVKPTHSLLDGEEDVVGHTQYSPDRDRAYAYVWAKDEEEAKSIMLQLAGDYKRSKN